MPQQQGKQRNEQREHNCCNPKQLVFGFPVHDISEDHRAADAAPGHLPVFHKAGCGRQLIRSQRAQNGQRNGQHGGREYIQRKQDENKSRHAK